MRRAQLTERIGGTSTCWMPFFACSWALILAAAAAGSRTLSVKHGRTGQARSRTCSCSRVRRPLWSFCTGTARLMAQRAASSSRFGLSRRGRSRTAVEPGLPARLRLGLIKTGALCAALVVTHGARYDESKEQIEGLRSGGC